MTKLTPAQAYALQVKADRRAAAAERRGTVVKAEDKRVAEMYKAIAPKVTVKRVHNTKRRWTNGELDLLISLYLKHVDPVNAPDERAAITEAFGKVYPDRGDSAVCLGIMQIKALDAYHPAKGMTDTSAALIDKLHAADPDRFPGAASRDLDALLASIRG